jgi:hypothetical protein
MRRFLRKNRSAALPVDEPSNKCGKYGWEFIDAFTYRMDFTPPNVTELRGHLFLWMADEHNFIRNG